MKTNKLTKYICAALVLTFLASCSVSRKGTIAITKPIKTIENLVVGKSEVMQAEDIPRVIAIAPLQNQTAEVDAPIVLRSMLQSHLSNKNFQLIHTKEVDLKSMDRTLTPQQLAIDTGADAVLVGRITNYDSIYAGIYAHIKLGVQVELINTQGESLWSMEKTITSRAGGVSTSPWGVLLNAALAAWHLDDENLFAAADSLGREIAASIPNPEGYLGSEQPTIDMVIHNRSHQWLKYGDTITIGLTGDEGLRAIAEIDGIGTFDLKESESGFYSADIVVDRRWSGDEHVVTGKLIDKKGQVATQISPVGLLNFDNVNPSNIKGLVIDYATTSDIKLRWKHANEEHISYQISQLFPYGEKMIATTEHNYFTLAEGQNAFTDVKFFVQAIDRAGNLSVPSNVKATVYPIKTNKAQVIAGELNGSYSGVNILTKENSPYLVVDATVFTRNSSLWVEPGVKIKFTQSGSITVKGSTHFWGNEPIELTHQSDKSPAKQFLFLDTDKTVEISGVHMNKPGVGIDIKSGTPILTNIRSFNAKYSGLSISGNANVALSHCTVSGSSTSGIVLSGKARLNITECRFSNNRPFNIQNASVYPVISHQNDFGTEGGKTKVLGKVEIKK